MTKKGKSKEFKRAYRSKFLVFIHWPTALIVAGIALFVGLIGLSMYDSWMTSLLQKEGYFKPVAVSNLVYCGDQKLDLYLPPGNGVKPVVVFVHGGGWYTGNKTEKNLRLAKPLAEEGIALASIDYRLATAAPFPAQIQDLNCAIRYLKTRAKDFNIDQNRIGLFGTSAGAHLVILAANTQKNTEFTKGDFSQQNSNFQAAVAVNGLLDLTVPTLTRYSTANVERLLENSNYTSETISPIHYVSKDAVPQLIIYSTEDKSVRPTQSTNYIAAARKAGSPVEELKVDNADHNLEPPLAAASRPGREEIVDIITQFLVRRLKL